MTYDELSNIYDLRIYSNLLLDFFDGLSLPVVSFDTMKKVAEGLQKGTHASEFVSLMSKTEFQIIKLFSQLLSNCRQLESSASKYEEWYGIRVALSLLLLRKKYDKSFVKRTLLKLEDIDNENVKTLSKLIILLSKSSSEDLKTSYNSFYNIIKPKSIGPPAQDDSTLKTDASVSSANGDKLRASAEKAPSGNQEAPNKL